MIYVSSLLIMSMISGNIFKNYFFLLKIIFIEFTIFFLLLVFVLSRYISTRETLWNYIDNLTSILVLLAIFFEILYLTGEIVVKLIIFIIQIYGSLKSKEKKKIKLEKAQPIDNGLNRFKNRKPKCTLNRNSRNLFLKNHKLRSFKSKLIPKKSPTSKIKPFSGLKMKFSGVKTSFKTNKNRYKRTFKK